MAELDENIPTLMFILGPATEVMRVVFATVYCHEKMDSKKGTLTLRECFEERLKNTPERIPDKNKTVESYFKDQNPKILDSNILEERLDISFYCSAVTYFCSLGDKFSHFLSAEALKSVDEIRKIRNDFFHSTSVVDINDVEKLCTELLKKVEQNLGGTRIAEARPDINLLMKKVRNEKIDHVQYLKERKKFFEVLKDEFIKSSRRELENAKLKMATNPFTKLLNESGATVKSDHPIEELFTAPLILSSEKKVDFLEILSPHEEEKPAVVLSGQNGSGKSTLCHVIFDQWRKKSSKPPKIQGLGSVDFIVYVKLKFTKQRTLDDFLRKEYLVDEMKCIKKESLVALLKSLQVLCIIDGYDEKNENADNLICDIRACLPESRIIITSTPEFERDCKKAFLQKPCVIWKLEGFSNSERREFSTKVILMLKKDDVDFIILVGNFISYLESRPSAFESHLKLPLTVALMIFLWLGHLEQPDVMEAIMTVTQLHRHVFEMLKKKLLKNCLDCEKVIRVLHKIAFDHLKDNQHMLTEKSKEDMKQSCQPSSVDEVLEAFLLCDTKYENFTDSQCTRCYSFLHRPQMDFFSAQYVSSDLESSTDQTCLNSYFSKAAVRKYKGMFPYLAGCLTQTGQLSRHSKALFELCGQARIVHNDYNFWSSLLFETLTSNGTSREMLPDETLKKEIISHLRGKSWTLKLDATISGLKLLTYFPAIQSLDLSFDADVINTKELEETLKTLQDERCKLHSDSKTALTLHVKSQNFDRSYVKYFAGWCTLVKFTGCVGKNEVEQLKQCKIVNATIHDIETFNAVAKNVPKMENLEVLTILFGFPKSHLQQGGASPQRIIIERKNVTTELNFLRLTDEDITQTIQFVRAACPRPQGLNCVSFRGDLTYRAGVEIVKSLQDCVTHKLYVRSSRFLTEDQEKELIPTATSGRGKISFIIVWNDDEIHSLPENVH
ncbi:P-loop containing nucleoside triphosphate hydrolase [Trinorchestia longiramus]|nr:P-loop containing nucleoside triphosphate hydrolase [Trinorchestia longiramus]